jgi:hypothetical protein
MAENTLSSRSKAGFYRSRKGGQSIWHFQPSTCASTAQIRVGDVVQFDVNVSTANSRIVKSSTMANVPNVLSTAFLGIAVEDSTFNARALPTAATPADFKIPVVIADSQTEFKFYTKSAGSVLTSTLVGGRRAIGYDSTLEIFYADLGNSTAGDATLLITECLEPGTTNGAVAAKFISTNTARFVSGAF